MRLLEVCQIPVRWRADTSYDGEKQEKGIRKKKQTDINSQNKRIRGPENPLFICALSTSITWEHSIPSGDPPSHPICSGQLCCRIMVRDEETALYTVARDWRLAKAWLVRELSEKKSDEA